MPIQDTDVFTVIVTHNGADTICETLVACHAAAHQYGPIEIIDNASNDATLQNVALLSLAGVKVVPLNKNEGVAAAYNLALAHARRQGARWLLILDQDTRCQADLIEILLKSTNDINKRHHPVAALCPTVINRNFTDILHYPYRWNGRHFTPVALEPKQLQHTVPPIAIDSTLTSGTLYNVAALTSINGFCEKYFIDFVDHECHLRLRQKGFNLFWIPRARIYHQLGYRQIITPAGLWIEHSPYRYYYMMRNMIEGNYRLGGLPALVQFVIEALCHCCRILRYGKAPFTSFAYILIGALHAARDRFGALDSY